MGSQNEKTLKAEFAKLATLEPRLLVLLKDIDAARIKSDGKSHACGNALWYGTVMNMHSFKDRLCELVGWERGETAAPPKKRKSTKTALPDSLRNLKPVDPEWYDKEPPPLPPGPLYTEDAYNVAQRYLYSRLPACRGCLCFRAAS